MVRDSVLCHLWLLAVAVTAVGAAAAPPQGLPDGSNAGERDSAPGHKTGHWCCDPEPEPCDMRPEPVPAPYEEPELRACARSCLQLRNQGGEHADGVYWLTGMTVPVLCDFSLDGGGWTLLVAAVSSDGWDALGVLRRAQSAPTLTDNYSILQHADAIRDLGTTGRFAYRIEAQAEVGRQRWGGVWLAPRSYSFVSDTPAQTDVTLYRRFDQWQYKNLGIEQHMPWINIDDQYDALLTTSASATTEWWGTLVSHQQHTQYQHSPWMNGELPNSGNTLYWMREEEA